MKLLASILIKFRLWFWARKEEYDPMKTMHKISWGEWAPDMPDRDRGTPGGERKIISYESHYDPMQEIQ